MKVTIIEGTAAEIKETAPVFAAQERRVKINSPDSLEVNDVYRLNVLEGIRETSAQIQEQTAHSHQ